jgi:hypothetical protein
MILLLFACADPAAVDSGAVESDVVDDRLDPTDVDAVPEGGEQWYGPEVVVEPGQEVQYCTFGTYTGPDIGITSFESWQGKAGHHLILLGSAASPLDYADGQTVDCTQTNTMMTSFEPLINAEPIEAGRSKIELPEGMAVKLREGQRYVFQAHYVNTTTERLLERDIMNVGFMPIDEVEEWAAAFALTQVNLSLPPAQASELTFDCAFDEPYEVMYLTGHLHEYGTRFSFEYGTGEDLTLEYEIPEWDPVYRDAPPLNRYERDELWFEPGGVLRTNCEWFNDTDEVLEFPAEMCATYGMLVGSTTPVVCSD